MTRFTELDKQFMARALSLAGRGGTLVRPNPMVGCVLVKGGRVVGEGFHSLYGGPHAEVVALQKAGRSAKGATAYVTLEPCSHYGKTGPCAPALNLAGVRSVVLAMRDPNPLVSGRGIRLLRKAGISVKEGLMTDEARRLNRPFSVWITRKRPYVILKMAMTLDGKIAAYSGDSRWVSGPEARTLVHSWRSAADAVMVGPGTALVDNPLLTAHGRGADPLRIVIDPRLSLPSKLKLFSGRGPATLVWTGIASPARLKAYSAGRRAAVLISKPKAGWPGIQEGLARLFSMGVHEILLEGGGGAAWRFLEERCVDEIRIIVSPKIVGGKKAPTPVEGAGFARMSEAVPVADFTSRPIGNNVLLTGYLGEF